MTQSSISPRGKENERLKLLGLTGGIAAGKSLVSSILRTQKGCILDADKLSHEVILKGNPAYDEILQCIPGEYLRENEELDRKKLGDIVFSDKEKLRVLEGIVHKHAAKRITEEIESANNAKSKYDFIVLDAPLLFESGTDKICDRVWIVAAEYEIRLKRIIKRNSLTRAQAENRIKIQTDWDNIQVNNCVFIYNNGNIEDLTAEVNKNLLTFLED